MRYRFDLRPYRTAPLRNLRAVAFNITGVLLPPAALRRPPNEPAAVLDLLRFLGFRLATVGTDADRNALATAGLAAFFAAGDHAPAISALPETLNLAPVDILHVGSDLKADVNTALAAQMRAAWLPLGAPAIQPAGDAVRINHLSDLPELLRNTATERLCSNPNANRQTRNLVALLRGMSEEAVPVGRRHENPASNVGELILEIVSQLNTAAKPLEILQSAWAEIINTPRFISQCEPSRLAPNGTLTVTCTNDIVRSELRQWHSRKILDAASRLCPDVKKISFISLN
jgi:hypothetical protein